MNKIFRLAVPLTCLFSILSSCSSKSQDWVEIDITVDSTAKNIINRWFQIQKEFITTHTCKPGKKKYASAYLCIREKDKDTVFVITPCLKNKYRKNGNALLFDDDNIVAGEMVTVNIPKEQLERLRNRSKVIFGVLKVPYD